MPQQRPISDDASCYGQASGGGGLAVVAGASGAVYLGNVTSVVRLWQAVHERARQASAGVVLLGSDTTAALRPGQRRVQRGQGRTGSAEHDTGGREGRVRAYGSTSSPRRSGGDRHDRRTIDRLRRSRRITTQMRISHGGKADEPLTGIADFVLGAYVACGYHGEPDPWSVINTAHAITVTELDPT